jgi:hypothetical protein
MLFRTGAGAGDVTDTSELVGLSCIGHSVISFSCVQSSVLLMFFGAGDGGDVVGTLITLVLKELGG